MFWDVTPCRLVKITDITERKIRDFIFRVRVSKLFPTLGDSLGEGIAILRNVGSFILRHDVQYVPEDFDLQQHRCDTLSFNNHTPTVPCSRFLKPRLSKTTVVRWVTINSLQRSRCNLASDDPEAESTSPVPGRAEVYQVVAPSCLGATPT